MSLNFQKILQSDLFKDLVDKINANFSVLENNYYGPKGPIGNQGIPGLPGLEGPKGDKGDNLSAGNKNVTFIDDDSNWNVLYGVGTSNPFNADGAIQNGYKVGDVWVDNLNGIMYDIHEDTSNPGHFKFVSHPLSSYSFLVAGSVLVPDTSNNVNNNDALQGFRNSNRFSTFSLTSFKSPLSPINGESANYNDIGVSYGLKNNLILNYNRSGFKLSIDNVSGDNSSDLILRVSNSSASKESIFNLSNNSYIPLIYLSNANQNPSQTNSFGFLINSINNNVNGGLLILKSSGDSDYFYIDTYKTGVSRELFIHSKNGVPNYYIRHLDLDSSFNTLNIDTSFWFSVGSKSSSMTSPPYSANDFLNLFGIENKLFKVGVTNNSGRINFYTYSAPNTNYIMSLNENGSVTIGNNNVSNSYNSKDINEISRVIIKSLNSTNQAVLNTVWIQPYQTNSNVNRGLRLSIGFDTSVGATIISGESDTSSINDTEPKSVVFYPDYGIVNYDTSHGYNPNTDGGKVSIGVRDNQVARFTVSGNAGIGKKGMLLTTSSYHAVIPDYSLYVNRMIAVRDIKPLNNLYSGINDDNIQLSISHDPTYGDGSVNVILKSKLIKTSLGFGLSSYNGKSSSIWFNHLIEDPSGTQIGANPLSSFVIKNVSPNLPSGLFYNLSHLVIGRDFTFQNTSNISNGWDNPKVSIVFDSDGRISIGGDSNTTNYIPYNSDVYSIINNTLLYSKGYLLTLRKVPASSTSVLNDNIEPSILLETDSTSDQSGSLNYRLNKPKKQPEIVFKSNFKPGNVSYISKIKQGYTTGDKVFFTPSAQKGGLGGVIAVFSDDNIDGVFNDDWQIKQVYNPLNTGTGTYNYGGTPPNISEITASYIYDDINSTSNTFVSLGNYYNLYTTPPSLPQITKGGHVMNGKNIYTHPSFIVYKKLNERFVFFKFRIGFLIENYVTDIISFYNQLNARVFRFRVNTPIMNIMPYNKQSRNSAWVNDYQYNLYDNDNKQWFLDGLWFNGAVYSNNINLVNDGSNITPSSNSSDSNLMPMPNLKNTSDGRYISYPVDYFTYNGSSIVKSNSNTILWTVSRYSISNNDNYDGLELYITLPVNPLYIGATRDLSSTNTTHPFYRQFYFTGHGVLDSYNIINQATGGGGGGGTSNQ